MAGEIPAPQAQEETRGAPAPHRLYRLLQDGEIVPDDAESLRDDCQTWGPVEKWVIGRKWHNALMPMRTDARPDQSFRSSPQAPAPASPAGREWWLVRWPSGTMEVRSERPSDGQARFIAENIRVREVVEAPAAPEAGAPGTPQPGRICTCLGSCKGAEGLAPGWTCALLPVVPPTQTQEGGSQQ